MRLHHLALLLIPAAACAGETVYYFVDEHGVQHYSNVPHDSRYKPLGPALGGAHQAAPVPTPPARAEYIPPAPSEPEVAPLNPVIEPEEIEELEPVLESQER